MLKKTNVKRVPAWCVHCSRSIRRLTRRPDATAAAVRARRPNHTTPHLIRCLHSNGRKQIWWAGGSGRIDLDRLNNGQFLPSGVRSTQVRYAPTINSSVLSIASCILCLIKFCSMHIKKAKDSLKRTSNNQADSPLAPLKMAIFLHFQML